jgi:hypothetical protein
MKEQKISFETAKLAKEKGVNKIWCNNMYCIGYNDLPEIKEIIVCSWRDNVDGQFHLALAPTQSLLQKWLRETHKIYVQIYLLSIGDEEEWCYKVSKKKAYDNPFIYKKYEDALESGLKEALNLIKNSIK